MKNKSLILVLSLILTSTTHLLAKDFGNLIAYYTFDNIKNNTIINEVDNNYLAGVVITLHKEQCPENQLKYLFDLAQSLANNPPKFFMVIYEDCVFEFNTVRALCKTINHEWENCQTKTISLINQPRKNLAKIIIMLRENC